MIPFVYIHFSATKEQSCFYDSLRDFLFSYLACFYISCHHSSFINMDYTLVHWEPSSAGVLLFAFLLLYDYRPFYICKQLCHAGFLASSFVHDFLYGTHDSRILFFLIIAFVVYLGTGVILFFSSLFAPMHGVYFIS